VLCIILLTQCIAWFIDIWLEIDKTWKKHTVSDIGIATCVATNQQACKASTIYPSPSKYH
jgi:hypothetical protein